MAYLKNNALVIAAFGVPLLLIAAVAISVYIPPLLLSTEYDFVYATCDPGVDYFYDCGNYLHRLYKVENGKLVVLSIPPDEDLNRNSKMDFQEISNLKVRFFLHDTDANESKEITLAEVQQLSLNDLLTSPDGVTVVNGYERNNEFFFLFGGGSQYGYYLEKGNKRSKLNVVGDERYYYDSRYFRFIGWVK